MEKKIRMFLLYVEMTIKSPLVRTLAVNFLTGVLSGTLALTVQRNNNYKPLVNLANTTAIIGSGLLVGRAVNQAFDSVLEESDEALYREWNRRENEL